jgi:ketosteroid isomerase-like protein
VSQENVEARRRGLDAFRRGVWSDIEETYDPNVVLRPDPRWPESSCIFGRDAVVDFFRALVDAGGSDVHDEEVTDFGDRLIVRQRWNISGQRSGAEAVQHHTVIATFRAGRIILLEFFFDHTEALKAVGLEE